MNSIAKRALASISDSVRKLNPDVFQTAESFNAPKLGRSQLAPSENPLVEVAKPNRKKRDENKTDTEIQDAELECDKAQTLGGAATGEEACVGGVRVRFRGYRVRPLDPDNFAGSVKDCLDYLRHAGLIPGDEPWKIALTTEQVKVKSFKQEKTEIEIEEP